MENKEHEKEIIQDFQNKTINNPETSNFCTYINFFEAQNKNNKNILNCIYGKDIFIIIEELSKAKIISDNFMKNTDEELNKNYDSFQNKVLNYINSTTNKIINAFHIDLYNINKENLKIIQSFVEEKILFLKKVLSLYKQIIEVIQQNFIILKNFLQNFDLNHQLPLQDFFTKEFNNITNSWLFLKLDLEKFNFKSVIENSNLNMNYKDFLMKECHEKSSVMDIILPDIKQNSGKNIPFKKDKYKDKIKIISDNSSHLIKLNMKNVPVVDDFLGKIKYDKLEKLQLKNSYILNNDLFNQFSSLNKLSVKYCPSMDTFIFNNINISNLKELILDKNGFVNEDLDNLLTNFILKSQDILNNLEIFSLAYNDISNIDFNHYLSLWY